MVEIAIRPKHVISGLAFTRFQAWMTKYVKNFSFFGSFRVMLQEESVQRTQGRWLFSSQLGH